MLVLLYRYGFNGKEKDEGGEWGNLTHYDYGFRIYNPGIARFLSVDPLARSYSELTPYQFASNTPIQAIDLDGLEMYRDLGNNLDHVMLNINATKEDKAAFNEGFVDGAVKGIAIGSGVALVWLDSYTGFTFTKGLGNLILAKGAYDFANTTSDPYLSDERNQEAYRELAISGVNYLGFTYGTNGTKLANPKPQGPPIALGSADETIINSSKWLKPKEGYTDVIVHGKPDKLQVLHNGEFVDVSHRDLATFIEKNTSVVPGETKIRLCACNTGSLPNGVAQDLSNKLGVVVEAPDNLLWVLPNGTTQVGPSPYWEGGAWKTFKPKSSKPNTTNDPSVTEPPK